MNIPKPNEWDSNLCVNSGTNKTFGDLYNIAIKLKEEKENLLKALEYSHRFASRDDCYDKSYVQDIIEISK
jgi:endonuclease IV